MKIFDMMKLEAFSYEQREKNVFFQSDTFKIRIIELKPGQSMPKCKMDCYVLFYIVKGEVEIMKNDHLATLKENQVFITEPALLAMETKKGARIMGVQIKG